MNNIAQHIEDAGLSLDELHTGTMEPSQDATQPDRTVAVVRPQITIDELRIRPSVTVEEAASALGIGRSSAYAAVRSGELAHVRLGKRVIIPASAVLRLLEPVQPQA